MAVVATHKLVSLIAANDCLLQTLQHEVAPRRAIATLHVYNQMQRELAGNERSPLAPGSITGAIVGAASGSMRVYLNLTIEPSA